MKAKNSIVNQDGHLDKKYGERGTTSREQYAKEFEGFKTNALIKETRTFDELLDIKYGKVGTAKRDKFEVKAKEFVMKQTKIKVK